MSVEKNLLKESTTPMCIQCKSFYGCQAYQGMCSDCFKKKKSFKEKLEIIQPKINAVKLEQSCKQLAQEKKQTLPTQIKQKNKKRCYKCNKNVGLLGIQCKCKLVYCNFHRLPQQHQCQFDHYTHGQNYLKKQIVQVKHAKIEEI